MKTKRKRRELITRAEYAKRKGVAARTIGKYVQKKMIPLHKNKIDPEEADRLLAEVLVQPLGSGRLTTADKEDKKAEGGPEKSDTDTYVGARTREKQLKVELLELDIQLKRGEMVLTKDVEFAAFSLARAVRDRMLNIPDRVAAILAAEHDETKVYNILIEQIENELRSIAKDNISPDQPEG